MAASHRTADMALPQAEINWDRLDKTKFYLVGAGIFSGISGALYPISVIKTRLQVVGTDSVHKTAGSIFRHIVSTEGIRGLYRGFGIVITGAIPSRMVFMTSLETTKAATLKIAESMELPETTAAAVANGAAGLISSMASQTVFVPLDVVSQRLMVQGTVGTTHYSGSMDAVRQILKADGIRGLYRGFGMSILTYSPSSAVWWAAYGSSQRFIWRGLGYGSRDDVEPPTQAKMVLVQASGGIAAGFISSMATTPMDTIKTRLQVLKSETEGTPTISQTVKQLVKESGWRGFYRGLGPRFVSMSLWGTSMITGYEFLKRLSVKQEE